MLKSILLISVASMSLYGVATAADLPSAKGPATYAAPMFTWAGFYVGGNFGYAYRKMTTTDVDYYDYGGSRDSTKSGFTGGGQIGYNFQTGSFVYGIEADANYVGGNSTSVGYDDSFKSRGGFLGTVRGRAGLAVDRALIYVTGGLAYGSLRSGYGYYNDNGGSHYSGWTGSATSSGMSVGYALGAGLEYAFSDHWTGRVEGLYANLGTKNVACSTTYCGTRNGIPYNFKFENSATLVRVGINYKF